MPYIDQGDRDGLSVRNTAWTVGELTFQLYDACVTFLRNRDGRFEDHALVLGALSAAQQEFYRRHVAPYEDQAIVRNGDVQ